MIRAAAFAALMPVAVQAADLSQISYTCERDTNVTVVYIESSGPDQIVLNAEGAVHILTAAPSADGRRFQNSPVVSDYVWWVKDRRGKLAWYNGNTGQETVLLSMCRELAD